MICLYRKGLYKSLMSLSCFLLGLTFGTHSPFVCQIAQELFLSNSTVGAVSQSERLCRVGIFDLWKVLELTGKCSFRSVTSFSHYAQNCGICSLKYLESTALLTLDEDGESLVNNSTLEFHGAGQRNCKRRHCWLRGSLPSPSRNWTYMSLTCTPVSILAFFNLVTYQR